MRITYKAAVLVAVLASGAECNEVWAQAADEQIEENAIDETNSDSGNGQARLSTIVVTAQRRSESLQDVPIAVTAISGEAALKGGITSTQDLTVAAPGLMVQTQAASVQMYMRGVGTDGSTAGTENAVATFVDGVYMPSMAGLFFSFNNIERIEVLKGPQGTLFGRNATGGAINIVTQDPAYEPELRASVGYGNLQRSEASFYGTTGLGDKAAFGLAAIYNNQDEGAGKNLFSGRDVNRGRELGINAKLLLEPSDALTIRLSGTYAYTNQSYGLTYRQGEGTVLFDGIPSFPGDFYDVNSDHEPASSSKTYVGLGSIEYDLGFATFKSSTSYQKLEKSYQYDNDGSTAPIVHVNFGQFDEAISQEFQLSSNSSEALTWMTGLYYFDDKAGYDPFRLTGAALAPLQYLQRTSTQKTKSYAAYGQASYDFGQGTSLTLGARYTYDKRRLTAIDDSDLGILADYGTQENSSDAPTWRLSLDHKITDEVMVYASYSRGFKSGVFNTAGPVDPPVNPEQLDDYEIGVKSELLDGRMRLNLAGFFYEYEDIQFSSYEGEINRLLNAASAEIYGVDLDVSFQVSSQLSLNASLEALHSEYSSFPGAPISTPQAVGNLLEPGDASGNTLIKAPELVFNTSVDYTIPLSTGASIDTNITYYYNDGFFWTPDNRISEPSYDIVNASVSWVSPDEKYRLSLWGKNLTSSEYLSQSTAQPLGDTVVAGAPRTYGVRLAAVF